MLRSFFNEFSLYSWLSMKSFQLALISGFCRSLIKADFADNKFLLIFLKRKIGFIVSFLQSQLELVN